ncbi:MAG: HD domain-containing protein [Desulfohalobiaceae bacterium]
MQKDARTDLPWQRLADFFFEVGMLRSTQRSGFQFLGSGRESVAEHSYRTSMIGLVLAKLSGLDWTRVVCMCLFHDLHEARTGDFNYVNRIYNSSQDEQALRDALQGTGLQEDIMLLHKELEEVSSQEAALAQDADQLDLILSLKQEQDLGNPYAPKWLYHAQKRLRTSWGQELAAAVLEKDHTDWWFKSAHSSWWSRANGRK